MFEIIHAVLNLWGRLSHRLYPFICSPFSFSPLCLKH